MATKPLELQSLKWPFVGLAVLLALCTGWAVYDEVFPRRPWKGYQRDFFQLEEKHLIYEAAIAHHQQTTKAREAFQARKDKAQAALDAMEKPSLDLKKKIETVSGKWPQMEQYWVQDLKNSWGGPTVDRCQNCHVAVNK